MSLEFAHGAIQWLSADGVGTTYTVSGLPFQPKAIRFYWMGLGSAVDAASSTTHNRAGVGFAAGTADRRCVAIQDQDAAGSMTCTTSAWDDCVAATVTSTPARDGALDLDALLSDGFRLIVDDAAPANITIFWEAWGGSDISAAGTGAISEPAAIGNQDYATGGVEASVAMLAGVQRTAVGSAARGDSGLCAGFAVNAPAGIEQAVAVTNNDDGSASSDTDSYGLGSECLAMIAVAGGNPSARATCTQFNASTGMRLDWLARATTGRQSIFLWIRGGQWRGFDPVLDVTILNETVTLSGYDFTPAGVSILSIKTVESTPGTSTFPGNLLLGTGSSPSSRRAQGFKSVSGTGSSEVELAIEYDQILVGVNAGAADMRLDLDAVNPGSFRLIVDVVGGSPHWLGCLTFGSMTRPTARRPFSIPIGA